MRIIELLEKNHREVEALLRDLQTDGADAGKLSQLRLLLLAHAIAEEETVYSVLEQQGGSSDLLEDSQDDHDEVEDLLDQCEAADGEERIDIIAELAQAVENHVAIEESETFQLLRKLSDGEAEALATGFAQRREEALQEIEAKR